MSRNLRGGVTLAALILCGCAQDRIVGRYRTAWCEVPGKPQAVHCDDVVTTATASAVSIPTPQSSLPLPPSGLVFSDIALATYIGALAEAKSDEEAAALRGRISAKFDPGAPPGTLRDASVFHRTLVVSVRKNLPFAPADRLTQVEIRITPQYYMASTSPGRRPEPVGRWQFDSWGSLATLYTTVNAGTVQLAQTRGITGTASVGLPAGAPVTAGLSVTPSRSDTLTENVSIAERKEDVSATVENGSLVIYREGGLNVDLTGNVVITTDISVPTGQIQFVHQFRLAYLNKKGIRLDPAKIDIGSTVIDAVPSRLAPDGLKALVELHYTVRHPTRGGGTYEERDDDIVDRTAQRTTATVLVPLRDIVTPSFGLKDRDGWLMLARPGRAAVGLCFASYQQAEDLLAYLKQGALPPRRLGDGTLYVGGFDPTSGPDPVDLKSLTATAGCF